MNRQRVQHKDTERTGTRLRLERYPGTGAKKWATVIWDDRMSTDRVEPADLVDIR